MTNILTNISRCLALALCFAALFAINGCKYIDKDAVHTEGEIIYDVTFPDQEQSILLNVYPSEMKMSFKDNMMHGKLESIGGLVSSEIIVDTEKKIYWQMLNSFGDKFSSELNEENVVKYITPHQFQLIENGSSDVLGMDCMSYNVMAEDSSQELEILSTKEIEIADPNWFTPYAGANGVLMNYELHQWGMRMKLTAREVVFKKIPDERFDIPKAYREIPVDSMYMQLEELLEEMPR